MIRARICALAAPYPSTAEVPALLGTLANARYVYVASCDGDQFNPTCFPKIAPRSAPCRTPFRSGGRLKIVYRPSEADLIIRLTSPPSEYVNPRMRSLSASTRAPSEIRAFLKVCGHAGWASIETLNSRYGIPYTLVSVSLRPMRASSASVNKQYPALHLAARCGPDSPNTGRRSHTSVLIPGEVAQRCWSDHHVRGMISVLRNCACTG